MRFLRETLFLVTLFAMITFANLTAILLVKNFKLVRELNRLKLTCIVQSAK